MSSRYFTERNLYTFAALVMLALLFTACGGSSGTTVSVSDSLPSNPAPVGGTSAVTALKHQPIGTANLSWDHISRMLTVQLMATGLAPNSVHPVHITQGSCSDKDSAHDKTLYPLVNVTADAYGKIDATSKVNLPGGIPAKGWYFTIYNGPGLSAPDQAEVISCGDILNSNTSVESTQVVQVPLQATSAANQNVSGTADLSLSGHTLTVKLVLSGMEPNSQHMAHIHAGSCERQGAVIYNLTPVKADASGKATVTTVVQNVTTIPDSGWYINVHYGTDLSTQTGFDPIACGDVTLSRA